MANNSNVGLSPLVSPITYQDESNRPKQVNIVFIVLGIFKYNEEDEEEKIWEIIDSRKELYDWLKDNFMWLNLEETKVFQSLNHPDKEYMVDLKTCKTAYQMLKELQSIFVHDDFEIDEVIDQNVF